jgi:hypothetical protein
MYSWSDDTSDWYGKGSYGYGEKGKDERDEASRRAAAAGPRSYGGRSGPNPAMIDPHKHIESQSKNPLVVAVDVTGSMARWPAEIFDRLPLFYNTLSQYREDLEVCFAAIGDAGVDRWPLQVTGFAKGYDLEQQLGSLFGEGGGGDAPESYGLFAWWVEHHVKVPNGDKPFLIVFGDAPMHEGVPKEQIQRLLGDATSWTQPNSLDTWRRLGQAWNVWFLRRPTGRKGDEVDQQWAKAVGKEKIFRIDDEQRAVDYAMGLVARAWGHFADFQKNMLARQDETKVKEVAEKIRAEGPRVLACPSCAARIPTEAAGRFTCTFCGSTLEL